MEFAVLGKDAAFVKFADQSSDLVLTENGSATRLRQSQEAGNDIPLAIARRSSCWDNRAAAEAACLDVYETASETAVPLPREIFASAHDTRWGVTSQGQYGQLAGPPG